MLSDSPGALSESIQPFSTRQEIRLTTVYGTNLNSNSKPEFTLIQKLDFGRLSPFFIEADTQLPQVLATVDLPPKDFKFTRAIGQPSKITCWIFQLPSQEIVFAISIDLILSLRDSIPLLEALYYESFTLSGRDPESWLQHHMFPQLKEFTTCNLTQERHQLVFAGQPEDSTPPTKDDLQRLIYRTDLPCEENTSSIRYPGELNRRKNTIGAVGPYVSVLIGQQDYLENSIFISTVHTVGAMTYHRIIRQNAYRAVVSLRESAISTFSPAAQRIALEELSDELATMELNLSFTVEAVAELGILIPAIRLEAFHQSLISSIQLLRRAKMTGTMLHRLRNSLKDELAIIESQDMRRAESRRIRTAVAVTFLTTVAGTLSLLFAFFGINSREIISTKSIFDPSYWSIYCLILGITFTSGLIYFAMSAWDARSSRLRTKPQRMPDARPADLR